MALRLPPSRHHCQATCEIIEAAKQRPQHLIPAHRPAPCLKITLFLEILAMGGINEHTAEQPTLHILDTETALGFRRNPRKIASQVLRICQNSIGRFP